MSNLPRGWRVKGDSEVSHHFSDLRKELYKVSDCHQLTTWWGNLEVERYDTRRCNLCEAMESSRSTLAAIRKAWDRT